MPVYEDKNAKDRNKRFYFNHYYTDENGKRKVVKKRGFATKKAAKEAEIKIELELNEGTYIKPNKINFGEMVRDWLSDKDGSVKKSTHGSYVTLSNHIISKLGHYNVSNLSHRVIQDFINEYKKNRQLSEENIRKLCTIINTILERAVEWGIIKKNVATKIELPKIPKKKPTIWTMDEAWEFLRVARGYRYYPAFLLALATGMRQGEILGLRWKDVDFDRGILTIEQALTHDGKRFETPKTNAGERVITLDEFTINVLQKQYNLIVKEKFDASNIYEDHGLAFPTANGTPCTPRNLYRQFKIISDKAGLTAIRFHDLRHCHATYLLELNQHPKKVAERLGHADSRMMDRYSHVMPHAQRQTADEFGKVFYAQRLTTLG